MWTRMLGSMCVGVILCGCASTPRWSGYTVEDPTAASHESGHGLAMDMKVPNSGDDCSGSDAPSSGSTPSDGMLDLPDHLKWGEVILPSIDAQHPERRALYARTPASGGMCVTLIAGGFGPVDAEKLCERGIAPPVVDKPSDPYWRGLFLESTTDSCVKQDLLYMRGGFLVVSAKPSNPVALRFPWPIIIRTPGLPGGAYAGRAVYAAVRSSSGGPLLKEGVYRPNEGGCECEGWPKSDGDVSYKVLVDSYGDNGREPHVLDKVSYVEMKGGAAREVTSLSDLDSQFLIDACAFANQVQKQVDSGTAPEFDRNKWRCTIDGKPKIQRHPSVHAH